MVQSMGLPSDCEPGSGAVDLDDFKRFMGRWLTEGTQGVDYFMHIGDILWKPAIKDHFTKTLRLWHLIGKYHVPQAELGVLLSDRNLRLCGFPWNSNEQRPDLVQRNRFWELVCPATRLVERHRGSRSAHPGPGVTVLSQSDRGLGLQDLRRRNHGRPG